IIKEAKRKQTPLVIDSHVSHYLPKKYVDLCIVTKTNLKKLKKRLQKRNYSKAKIRENMDCEIFDVCLIEAQEAGHRVKVVET
ncbi:AAA family ATPase, partial [Candidatus Woesearchaeota archaeon]|nr:AAA family ATPase [Candidatus Woesearchaeota archaeon]